MKIPSINKALSRVVEEISESEDFYHKLTRGNNLLDYETPTVIMKSGNNNVHTIFDPKGKKIYFKFINDEFLPKGILHVTKTYGKNNYVIVANERLFKHVKAFFEKEKLVCKVIPLKKFIANLYLDSEPARA